MNYDRLILGSGQVATDAAIAAARDGRHVAIAASTDSPADWMTAKILRQAADRLIPTGYVSMSALRREAGRIIEIQRETARNELSRRCVDRYFGLVRFMSTNTISVGDQTLAGNEIILACGTRTAQFGHIPFDSQTVLSAEQLLSRPELPESIIIIGAGKYGLEHAVVLARLGVRITIIDEHVNMFDLCGGLMGLPLLEAQVHNIAFRLGDEVIGIEPSEPLACVRLASGRILKAEAILICAGREGRTDDLGLDSVGVGLDEHGRVWCDAQGRTWNPQIIATGEVIGFRASPLLVG